MRRTWQVFGGLFLVLMVAAGFGGREEAMAAPPDSSQKITIRFSHGWPPTHMRHKSAMKWKEVLEKESGGQVEVKIYPAAQLVKNTEEVSYVMMGNIDMCAPHGGSIASLVPLWDIFVMPFFWPNDGKNFEPAWKFKKSEIVRKLMISKLEEKGFKFIGWNTSVGGSGEFSTTKKHIQKISDFKGLKMNTSAGWLRYEAVSALGASCVTLPTSETGQALAQGTIDGEFGTTIMTYASGWPAKYIYWWPSWTNCPGSGFLMNMKKWNSLPDNIKKIIETEATPQMENYTNKEILVEEAAALEGLKKRGMEVSSDPELQAECAKKLEFLPDAFAKKYGKEAGELVAAARAMMGK